MNYSQSQPTIKIMLVEDHPEYRETLEFVFNKDKNLELICQFSNAEQAVLYLQKRGIRPDVILLDLNLPKMSGLQAMSFLTKSAPLAKIVILSQSDVNSDILQAIQQGASGYLLKSATIDEIKRGIHIVMDGGAALDPSLARFIIETLQPKLPKNPDEMIITNRELEVLSLIGQGFSQKEVSRHLRISTYTISDHLKHIYEKMDVVNAPAAVAKAYEIGLLPLAKDK